MHTTLDRRDFLQRLAVVGIGTAGCLTAFTQPVWAIAADAGGLPRSLPAAQGVASQGLLEFLEAIEASGQSLHSLMVVRHGQVVAEGWWAPYAPELRHTLYSLSKSFTSTAVGLAADAGLLTLDDKVVSFFPDDLPASVSDNLAAMRVKDLLMMGSGHAKEALFGAGLLPPEQDWVKAILAQPVEFAPGTHFVYNNACSYLLSAIVQKVSGQTELDFLGSKLFEPLGIQGADWEIGSRGVNTGGWGLRVKTEDIAKLGQLYLQKGIWNGKRLLSEDWIDQATKLQIRNAKEGDAGAAMSDWGQGYGYQFWRSRHGGFRGDGAFGQFCLVLPKQDAVIAITGEYGDMQAVLNAVWKHLLPALEGGKESSDSAGTQAQLAKKLASLALPLPAGETASPIADRAATQTFEVAANKLGVKRVSLAFDKDKLAFTLLDDQGEHRVECGMCRWIVGETDLSAVPLKLVPTVGPGESKMKLAASAAWSDEHTLVMFWRFIETAHYQSVTCRFDRDEVRVEFKKSLAILNPGTHDGRPVLVGKQP